jgi:hypothetical protein
MLSPYYPQLYNTILLQEDPVPNAGEFGIPPAYSSFLFKQLLQNQYCTSSPATDNTGLGYSLNINNITFNTVNLCQIQDFTLINGQTNGFFMNITPTPPSSPPSKPYRETYQPTPPKQPEPERPTSPKAEESSEGSANTPDAPSESPSPIITTPPSPPNDSNDDNDSFDPLKPYQSTFFRTLLSSQQNKVDDVVPEELFKLAPTTPIYPVINLLEVFGEQEMVKRNKRRLQSMLYGDECKIATMKMHTARFVPSELRPMVWQLLFGYLPEEKMRRETVLLDKQRRYQDMLISVTSKNNDELFGLIEMDVLRTMPEGYEPLFGNALLKQSLSRVLLIWARQHPETGYFQGLNDLASVFFATFLSYNGTFQVGKPNFFDDCDDPEWDSYRKSDPDVGFGEGLLQRVEADVYWCLSSVMDALEHLNANSKCGVHAETMMSQLEALVKRIDPALSEHMNKENIEFVHFAFRWMLCLFVRELPLDLLLVLWDFYASCEGGFNHGFSVMPVYVCAAFLQRHRHLLMNMEFIDMLKFLHHPPTQNWTTREVYDLIEKAKALYNMFP